MTAVCPGEQKPGAVLDRAGRQLTQRRPVSGLTRRQRATAGELGQDLIRERPLAGLAAARREGGRPGRRTLTPEKVAAAGNFLADPEFSVSAGGGVAGVSQATLHRHVAGARDRVDEPGERSSD